MGQVTKHLTEDKTISNSDIQLTVNATSGRLSSLKNLALNQEIEIGQDFIQYFPTSSQVYFHIFLLFLIILLVWTSFWSLYI